jgi:hypothetical protein
VPDRRVQGRRAGEAKADTSGSAPAVGATPAPPPGTKTPPVEQREETEPDRRHFLHRKIGGKKKAA